jgi:1,4-dihydroxy-2-naphthoate octaprenyltransferase
MTAVNATGAAQLARRRSVRQTLSAYARLSNLKVYFQWIPALVGWSLAPAPFRLHGGGLLALLLFVVAVIAMACAAGTLDDLQGLHDGLDRRTYAADQALRSVKSKPLVQGEIGARAARRYAFLSGAVGLGLGVVGIGIAPHGQLWLVACWLAAAYAATQYSYGLKLSYHGAGELLLGVEAALVMLGPLAFLSGSLTAAGCFEAYLLGTLFAQVTVFSSSQDAEIDGAFKRMTIAARSSAAGNRRFIATVFAVGWTVTATGFAVGAFSPWLALALLPTWVIQVAQLIQGVRRERWLLARSLGWRAFDAGVLALLLVNLVAG